MCAGEGAQTADEVQPSARVGDEDEDEDEEDEEDDDEHEDEDDGGSDMDEETGDIVEDDSLRGYEEDDIYLPFDEGENNNVLSFHDWIVSPRFPRNRDEFES